MTPVPASLLRQTITGRPHEGEGADGPVFGEPRTVRARVVGRRRVVRSSGGNDLTSTHTATVRPGDEFPVESEVTYDGDPFHVAEVIPVQGLARPAGYELVLV